MEFELTDLPNNSKDAQYMMKEFAEKCFKSQGFYPINFSMISV